MAKSDAKNPKIWSELKTKIDQTILQRETSQKLEFEMQNLMKQRKSVEEDGQDQDHLNYLNERIEEAQQTLCDLTGKASISFSNNELMIRY